MDARTQAFRGKKAVVVVVVLAVWPGIRAVVRAQSEAGVRALTWQALGARSVELDLAGPAGGGVTAAAFTPDGASLVIRTARGNLWVTSDLGETWRRVEGAADALRPAEPAEAATRPAGDPGAVLYRHPYDPGLVYALGENLHRSSDGGRTWVNLTGDALGSVIGSRQRAIAFSPADPDLIVVANDRGLWRSADGGLSWSSLNLNLPNLPPARLGVTREGAARVFLEGVGPAEWSASGSWQPVADAGAEAWIRTLRSLPEGDQRRASPWPLRQLPRGWAASFRLWRDGAPISPDLTGCAANACADPERHYISAFAASGGPQGRLYAGTSDGHIWVSADGGRTWVPPQQGFAANGNPVWSLWADPRNPFAALAAVGGQRRGHVFRTTNGGLFWDDLSANLPDAPAYAVTANSETGSIYAGTEAGLFYTRGDLSNPGPPTPWTRLGGNLPGAPIEDVRLDTTAGALYVSAAGYGVYRAASPDLAETLRILNAADLSTRAAAPGGLLTVFGAAVRTARANAWNAPVLASGNSESQIQVPFEASGSTLNLALETQRGLWRVGVPLEAVSPAIFLDADGSPLVLDAGAGVLLDASRPARAGSQILILATGLGRVRPEWPTGLAAPLDDPPATVAPVTAYLNGAPLRVISSTLAGGYIGVYMVRAELPAVLNSGTGELAIAAGEKTSNRVRIFVEP